MLWRWKGRLLIGNGALKLSPFIFCISRCKSRHRSKSTLEAIAGNSHPASAKVLCDIAWKKIMGNNSKKTEAHNRLNFRSFKARRCYDKTIHGQIFDHKTGVIIRHFEKAVKSKRRQLQQINTFQYDVIFVGNYERMSCAKDQQQRMNKRAFNHRVERYRCTLSPTQEWFCF